MPAVKRLSATDMPTQSCIGGGDRWSTLLPELLVLILHRLPSLRDRINFGYVCSWWRTKSRHLLPPTVPLLMLPYKDDDLYPQQVHGILPDWVQYRILLLDTDSQYMSGYQCHRRRPGKVICGSSMGWLLVSDCCGGGYVHLWNPITRAEIPLPRYKSCVRKAVFSSNPCSSSQLRDRCTVMVISKYAQKLSFCRIRDDDSWTTLEENTCDRFEDVVFYRGQFCAVTNLGRVVVLGVGPNPKMKAVAEDCNWYDVHTSSLKCCYTIKNYLVESSGELLRVTRIMKVDNERAKSTIKFMVHKLNFSKKTMRWTKVVSLGDDQTLFLGLSSSVSFAVGAASGRHVIYKRNCIYFLDDSGSCESDMGVFDLGDGSVTTFDKHTCSSSKEKCSPTFWSFDTYPCSSKEKCSSFLYSPQFWFDLAPWRPSKCSGPGKSSLGLSD